MLDSKQTCVSGFAVAWGGGRWCWFMVVLVRFGGRGFAAASEYELAALFAAEPK